MNKYGEAKLYIIVRPIIKLLFGILYHPHINGKDKIPKSNGVVLAGNHTSILDCLLLMSCTKREIHFLAKKELFIGVKGIIFKNMGLIPVDRNKKNPEALRDAKRYLEKGKIVLVFPEGTTEKGRGLMDFKIGAVKMSYDTQKEILPFVIEGKYKILGKGISITFLDPIKVKSDDLDNENKYLHNLIKKKLKGD